MNIGLDIGYSHTKAVTTGKQIGFPSIVGTPDVSRFTLDESQDSLILTHPAHVQVGEHAISQSRFTHRREDRACPDRRRVATSARDAANDAGGGEGVGGDDIRSEKAMIRKWNLWIVYDDGEHTLLNEHPFVGDIFEAGCEADKLAIEIDGYFDFELESLGIMAKAADIPATNAPSPTPPPC